MCLSQFFETYGQMISTLLLTGTLVVLVVYTVFTHGLKKATVKQNELRQRPCVILVKGQVGHLILKNIGHSPALNIEIEPLEGNVFRILFGTQSLLEPDSFGVLGFRFEGKTSVTKKMVKEIGGNVWGYPFFESREKDTISDYFLTVHYNNIEKVSFQTVMKVLLKEKKVEFIETKRI